MRAGASESKGPELWLKPDCEVQPERGWGTGTGAALLISFDVSGAGAAEPSTQCSSNDQNGEPEPETSGLEWRLSLWRDANTQLTAEERFPVLKSKSTQSGPRGTTTFQDALFGLFLQNEESTAPDVVVILLQTVFAATGAVHSSASRELHLCRLSSASVETRVMQSQSTSTLRLCAGHNASCPEFLKFADVSVSISFTYAMLPLGISLRSLTCQDRVLVLLRPPRPAMCAQLLALNARVRHRQASSIIDTSPDSESITATRFLLHNEPQIFESTSLAIADAQLAQDLHDCYKGSDLLVSACFTTTGYNEPRGPVALLGSLTASSGEYLSTVFIPETHCLHGHCVDHSRFLKVFVTATTRRDTLTTTWEVCAGVIDLLQLTYAPDELEQDSQTTTPDGCMSVDGTVELVLKAAPMRARDSSVYVTPESIDDKSQMWNRGNQEDRSIAVGKLTLHIQIIRLMCDCSVPFHRSLFPSLLIHPTPAFRPFHFRRPWSWDGLPLSTLMCVVIDSLIADPLSISSFLCFDVDSTESSHCVDQGEGWSMALQNASSFQDDDKGISSQSKVHFDDMSLQEKCILLSLMAEILSTFPDMSNFLARLSLPLTAYNDDEGYGSDITGDELFVYFLPVVHRVLVHDLSIASGRGACDGNDSLWSHNVLRDTLQTLQCGQVLASYVEAWLQSNEFAELIADPFFLLASSVTHFVDARKGRDDDTCLDSAPQYPSNYDCFRELSRAVEHWETLFSVCCCVSVIYDNTEVTPLPFYRFQQDAVSVEAISTHMLVSILLYGATVLSDAGRQSKMQASVDTCPLLSCQSSAKLVELFVKRFFACVSMLLGKVLRAYSSANASQDEDWYERYCQLFVALARFTDSMVVILQEIPDMDVSTSHALPEMIMDIFSFSQFHMPHFPPELVDLEMLCLQSCMRCLSVISTGTSLHVSGTTTTTLRIVGGGTDRCFSDILVQLSTSLSSKVVATVNDLPKTVKLLETPAPPPPRARAKKRGMQTKVLALHRPVLSSEDTNTTLYTSSSGKTVHAFGDGKFWCPFGLSEIFTEADYRRSCAKVNELDVRLSYEHEGTRAIDEIGVMRALIHTMGARAGVVRDFVALINDASCASTLSPNHCVDVAIDITSKSPKPRTRTSVFSRLKSKQRKNISSDQTSGRNDASHMHKMTTQAAFRLRVLEPLQNVVCALWNAFLGNPLAHRQLSNSMAFEGSSQHSLAGSDFIRVLEPLTSLASSHLDNELAFREVAYISVKFHEWLFSLEESAADHANHLTMHAPSPDGRPACPFPIATCKAEELLVLDLNSLLHLFLEISTCRYRVTLQIPLVYPTGQQNDEEVVRCLFKQLHTFIKQDIEVLLMTANCLYLQVSLSPFLTEKSVTSHVLSLLGLRPARFPPPSSPSAYDSVHDWSQLWHKVTVNGIAMLLTEIHLISLRDSRGSVTHIMALLELMETHCSLAHLIMSRPDVVAVCMHNCVTPTLVLLLETSATVFGIVGSEGSSGDKQVSHDEAFIKLWSKFVDEPIGARGDKSKNTDIFDGVGDIKSLSASSSMIDILKHTISSLFQCSLSLVSNCAFLSTSAFNLPVGPSSKSKKHRELKTNQRPTSQGTSAPYLSARFVSSVVDILPQFVRALIFQGVATFHKQHSAMPLLSPSTNVFLPRPPGGKATGVNLGVFFCSLLHVLSKSKRCLQPQYEGGGLELRRIMGRVEAQVHHALYSMRCLLGCFIEEQIDANDVPAPEGGEGLVSIKEVMRKERTAFRHVWMVATCDALLSQRSLPWRCMGYTGQTSSISEEWGKEEDEWTKHIHFLESSMSAGSPSTSEKNNAPSRSVLCDLHGGTWRLVVSCLKLLLFDINVKRSFGVVQRTRESNSSNMSTATMAIATAFEHRHQLARQVLKWLLQFGEWEAGRELSQILLESFQRYITSCAEVPTTRKQTSTLDCPSDLASSHVLKALGRDRLETLSTEMKRAADTFDDRMRHEGAVRCLPLFYVVRFMCSPWEGGGQTLKKGEEALRNLVAGCGYTFVCVMPPPLQDSNGASTSTQSLGMDQELDSAVGIRQQEVWMLLKYDCSAFSEEEFLDTEHGKCGVSAQRYVEQIKSVGGPLGSYSRLVYQVAKAFPEFCMKSSSTLHALSRNCSSKPGDADTKVVQIFEAFPNIPDLPDEFCQNDEIGSLVDVHPAESVTIFADEDCHSSAFATAVLAGGSNLGVGMNNEKNCLSTPTVRYADRLSTYSPVLTFPPKSDSTFRHPHGKKSNGNPDSTPCGAPTSTFSHSGADNPSSLWDQYARCTSFLVHTCLHPSRYPTSRSSDAHFTTTLVLSASEVDTSDTVVQGNAASSDIDNCSFLRGSRLQLWMPARLVVVTSAVVLPSLVTHGFCVLRSHVRLLKHCETLLTHIVDNISDSIKRTDDVSSFFCIVRYVVACMSNLVGRHNVTGEDRSRSIIGIQNAASMICGETERRDILWQRSRRVIKHDHMMRKAAFDEWVSVVQSEGPDLKPDTVPPPCPPVLDIGALEQAFVSSLLSVDTIHMAALLGVSVSCVPARLNATVGALLDPTMFSELNGDSHDTSGIVTDTEEAGDDKVPKPQIETFQMVILLQRQAEGTAKRVLNILRQCLEALPDDDSVPITPPSQEENDTSNCSDDDSDRQDSSNTEVVEEQSGSTRAGWLRVLRWLEHSLLSSTV